MDAEDRPAPMPGTLQPVTRPLSPAEALVRAEHGVLSHATAAALHGLPMVELEPLPVVLTLPRDHSRRRVPGAVLHRRPLPPSDVVHRPNGLRLTGVERTICDLARSSPLPSAVAAADGAHRLGLVSCDRLRTRLRRERGAGARSCHEVAELLDVRCESVLESLVRVVLWTGPWPRPRTQHVVVVDGTSCRLDFAWPEQQVAVEADGFAFHSDRSAYRRDRERLNGLVSLGWRVLRVTYEDVMSRPGYITALVQACLGADPEPARVLRAA